MVSIKDVARQAGVSLGTVSNVLNRPDMVRPETRARVEESIEALGYVRNDSARQLRAGVSRSLAYLAFDAANPFFTDVARGIDEAARDEGLMLFLCDSHHERTREDAYLEQLLEQRVKGICITPVDPRNPRLRQAARRGVPIIMVDRVPEEAEDDWCSVGVDDTLGGELAVSHLASLGHRRLAFIGDTSQLTQSRDRLIGARAAADLAGCELTVIATDGMGVADGRAAGDAILATPGAGRPTAAFCSNDLIALGLLQHMTEKRLRVPDDMAIVGYDDIDFAAAAAVPLTSVSQPRHLLGRTAGELLLEEADSDGHSHRHVRFEPELVVRRSTSG